MYIDDFIASADKMPKIPAIVLELMQSFDDDNACGDAIADKVAQDQVLTAKVLRLANSAKFGARRNIASVKDAVVFLGFNNIRTVVMASGVMSAFPAPKGLDINRYWQDCFVIAELCKWLVNKLPPARRVNPDMAYTCGMIHNIGELLVHTALDQLTDAARADVPEPTPDNYDYPAMGAALAECWQFPIVVVAGIRGQQEELIDLEEGDGGVLAVLIHLAKYVQMAQQAQQDGGSAEDLLKAIPEQLPDFLSIQKVDVVEDFEQTLSLIEGLDSLLS